MSFDQSSSDRLAELPEEARLPLPRRWQARPLTLTCFGVVMFFCGAVTGNLSSRTTVASVAPPVVSAPGGGKAVARRVTDLIAQHFSLSQQGREQVLLLARDYERQINKSRLRFMAQQTPELETFISGVEQVLKPAQRKRWRRSSQRQLERLRNGSTAQRPAETENDVRPDSE